MNNTSADRLVARIDAMIRARDAANDAQQRYADGTADVTPLAEALGVIRRDIADDLYEASYELVHHIDNLLGSVDLENMILGRDDHAGGDQ